jgi:membrane glycosyltransferase
VSEGSIAELSPAEDSGRSVFGRRVLFAILVLLTILALLALAGYALSAGGFGFADGVLLLLFGLTMPWSVIGFWNATIGFFVMRFARDPVAAVNPAAARVRNDEPITASTAIRSSCATSRRTA